MQGVKGFHGNLITRIVTDYTEDGKGHGGRGMEHGAWSKGYLKPCLQQSGLNFEPQTPQPCLPAVRLNLNLNLNLGRGSLPAKSACLPVGRPAVDSPGSRSTRGRSVVFHYYRPAV